MFIISGNEYDSPDRYISQGTQDELRQECGLTAGCLEEVFRQEKDKIDKKNSEELLPTMKTELANVLIESDKARLDELSFEEIEARLQTRPDYTYLLG